MGRRKSARPSRSAQRPRRGTDGYRRRGNRVIKLGLLGVAGILVGVLVIYASSGQGPAGTTPDSSPSELRAVIVDQLSLTEPNPAFVESATAMLKAGGYGVDYRRGEDVTVEFYRDVPTMDYDLVILRVHAGVITQIDWRTGTKRITDEIALSTGELYDEAKYVTASGPRYPGLAAYRTTPRLFGITPAFIKFAMKGKFNGTTIILMGCDGLYSTKTAQLFVERGVGTFISWSELVSAPHTDRATERLLHRLVTEGLSPREAVAATMAEVGPDPEYGSVLRYYPTGG